jgi:hypothetical protein
VTAKVALPVGVLAVLVTVSVELPEPLIEGGENDAEAPRGKPAALKFTMPEKPFWAATFTV